uniref:Growth differentiation factor 10b n=1 Tax=Nothobranchius furzeri TaxID=105023 RepID=A0A1A8UPN2_NOTFU
MPGLLHHILCLLLLLQCGWARLAPEGYDVGAVRQGGAEAQPAVDQRVLAHESASRDVVSVNMFKVYERDSGVSEDLTTSPVVSGIPHHLASGLRHTSQIIFYGSSTNSAFGNITLAHFKKSSWQTRDVTSVVKQARTGKQLVIMAEFDPGFEASQVQQKGLLSKERLSAESLPYILVYADDQAIDEPNSVAMSLQRYGPFPVGEDISTSSASSRIRRELHLQIQTNDIPEIHFSTLKNHELWQNTYFPDKTKAAVKTGRTRGQLSGEGTSKPKVLSFDERTMKKARRRQWSEPRVCSRRYLRVDFADIGWSEWVLAPKSFEAYYCSGTCGFPIPKVAQPSNHATIQSIVRAVGIVPGVPEPCCVPDKMSPLSVLFLDPDRNLMLKVYPGMSVDSCACR